MAIVKKIASTLLQPLAKLGYRLNALQRLWSHASLAARLKTPVDDSVVVLGCPMVFGTGNIQVGKQLYLWPTGYWETQGEGRIELGDDVVLSRGVHLVAFSHIKIGAGTMIGEYSSLRDANHRLSINQSMRHSGYDIAPIVVGNNVWIGRGVTILPGVDIGDQAVIGANAVVTNAIPARSVAVGIPARVIKTISEDD